MRKLLCLVLFAAGGFVMAASANADDPTKSDHLQIQVQKICPVTGMKLGSMGKPVKTTIDGQTMFLCCKGCDGKPGKEEHMKTIASNMAKAQAMCPVMDEELPEDAESVVVEGRKVFVCCEGCIEDIKEDAKTYLAKVDELYAKSLKKEAEQSKQK